MRIHIQLPTSLIKKSVPGPSESPIVQIGKDLIVIELQGDLTFEGGASGKVIGILGLERMDKPTLHLGKHHLLHGKIVNLPRPLAVIRRADHRDRLLSKDEVEEEGVGSDLDKDMQELEEETQKPESTTTTEEKLSYTISNLASSPPPIRQSAARDYSSDLSSPVRPFQGGKRKRPINSLEAIDEREAVEDGEIDVDEEASRQERETKSLRAGPDEQRRQDPSVRTREYKVVGVIRKKVVFSLRPEPIVTATILPE